jgi:hypothetical protein
MTKSPNFFDATYYLISNKIWRFSEYMNLSYEIIVE